MSTKELIRFRDMLVYGRDEIFDRTRGIESAVMSLSEPEIELEEGAQKAAITEALNRLGKDNRIKMELIDLALRKISGGEYGICESCGDDIDMKRLEALPWTRLCIDCARDFEKRGKTLPQPEEAVTAANLPEEYAGLTDQQLLQIIYEQIDKRFDIDKGQFRISVRSGIIYLEGSVDEEVEHQLILQALSDDLGLGEIIDALQVKESDWENSDLSSDSIH